MRKWLFVVFSAALVLSLMPMSIETGAVQAQGPDRDPRGNPVVLATLLPDSFVYAAGVSPDGTQLAVVGDTALWVMDFPSGANLQSFGVGGMFATRLAWTADSAYLGVLNEFAGTEVQRGERTIFVGEVWDAATWELASDDVDVDALNWVFADIPDFTLYRATMSTAGVETATLPDGSVLSLGNPATVTGVRTFQLAPASTAAYYSERNQVVIGGQLWDLNTGQRLVNAFHNAPDLFTAGDSTAGLQLSGQYAVSYAYAALFPGAMAGVYVEDDGLSLRATADINGTLIEKMPRGSAVTIIGNPVQAGGYTWWQVQSPNGNVGWSVEAADGILTLEPLINVGNSGVYVYEIPEAPAVICELIPGGNINIRSGPATTVAVVRQAAAGERLTGLGQTSDGAFVWWQIADGWVRADTVVASADCPQLPTID